MSAESSERGEGTHEHLVGRTEAFSQSDFSLAFPF
jgi:hypothetical protein